MYKIYLIISLIFSSATLNCNAQSKADKRYVKELFHCIKNKDTVRYKKLFPDFEQLYAIYKADSAKNSDKVKDREQYMTFVQEAINNFYKDLSQLEKYGMVLKNAKLNSFLLHKALRKGKKNISELQGVLKLKLDNNVQKNIRFKNAFSLNKKWCFGQIKIEEMPFHFELENEKKYRRRKGDKEIITAPIEQAPSIQRAPYNYNPY